MPRSQLAMLWRPTYVLSARAPKSLESCHSLDSCSTSGHEDVSHAGVIKERDASDADVLTAALGVLHVCYNLRGQNGVLNSPTTW